MTFGRGFKPDTHATHDGDAAPYVASLVGGLAQPITYLAQVGGPLDQGQTSTCVGQAIKRAVDLRAAALGLHVPSGSATAIRNLALQIENRLDGVLGAPLRDVGCEPSLAVQGLRSYGFPSEASCPFGPTTLTQPISLSELEDADKRLPLFVRAFRGVTSAGTRRLQDVSDALSKGLPVIMAVCASTPQFQAGTGILTAWPKGMQTDHMTQLVESNDDGFILLNSWGSWANSGLADVDGSFVEAADHLFIVDLSESPT